MTWGSLAFKGAGTETAFDVTPTPSLVLTSRVFVMLSDLGKKPRSHFTSWLKKPTTPESLLREM